MEHNRLADAHGLMAARLVSRSGILALAAILAFPLALFAHARLRRSEPSAEARLATAPTSLRLWFTERPELSFTRIRLRGPDSSDVALGVLERMADDPTGVMLPIATTLRRGTYTVSWRTAAADGHATTGSFSFDVATEAMPVTASAPMDTMRGTARSNSLVHVDSTAAVAPALNVSAATRWLEFMAILAVVGAVVFRLVVLRLPANAASAALLLPADARAELADSARRLGQSALVLLLVAALSRLYVQGSAVLGPDRPFDRSALATILSTSWGHGWLVGVTGIALAAAGFGIVRYARSDAGWLVATLGALAIAVTPALTGHASATRPAAVARAADALHVIAASAWLGALLSLLFAALPMVRGTRALREIGSGPLVASLVRSFHPLALTCATIVVFSGLIASWLRLPTLDALWESTYGRVLLLKLAFVAIVVILGAINWRRMLPSLGDAAAARRIARTAGTELALAALVLAVTAVLVSTPTP